MPDAFKPVSTIIDDRGVVQYLSDSPTFSVSIPTVLSGGISGSITAEVNTQSELINVVSTNVAYVKSFRDFAVFRSDSTATIDNVTIFSGSNSTGRWERLKIPHPSWASQANIWVNPSTGNDENDGTSQTQSAGLVGPVKTLFEVFRRLGPIVCPPNGLIQTVWIEGDCTDRVTYDTRVSTSPATGFVIRGVMVARTTGSLFASTNYLAGTTATTVNVETAPGVKWVPATERKRVVIATATGQSAWVRKDLTGGTAEITRWNSSPAVAGLPGVPSVGNVAAGAAVTTYTLSRWVGPMTRCLGGQSVIADLEIYDVCNITPNGGGIVFNRCWFPSTANLNAGLGQCILANCLYEGSAALGGREVPSRVALFSGWLGSSLSAGVSYLELAISNDITIAPSTGTALSIQIGNFGKMRMAGGAYWSDITTGHSIEAFFGSHLLLTANGCWSSGCTSVSQFAKFRAGSTFSWRTGNVFTATHTGGDMIVGGQTSLYAWDDTNHAYTDTKRSLTWTNLVGTFVGGGFGANVNDPSTGWRAGLEA